MDANKIQPRDRPAGQAEIEINSEVLAAGVRVIRASGVVPWNVEGWVAEGLAQDIFLAMFGCSHPILSASANALRTTHAQQD